LPGRSNLPLPGAAAKPALSWLEQEWQLLGGAGIEDLLVSPEREKKMWPKWFKHRLRKAHWG